MSTAPPLADRMRPTSLAEVVGQSHLVGEHGLLKAALDRDRLPSMLLWGPPGCGKTTLARLVAQESGAVFLALSAVLSGIKDLRSAIERAKLARGRVLLFVDEIHRWNKAQQDALLPHVEAGTVSLVGATTENPSFSIIAPLRSRAEVVRLLPLVSTDIEALLDRALADSERGLGHRSVTVEPDVLLRIAELGGGDARRALGLLERLVETTDDGGTLTAEGARDSLARRDILYDRAGDEHFNVVSALIKSMRGSDPDAALYWLARMLAGGDDVVFIARRLMIFASEDIGNADPRALTLATSACQAVQVIGLPEGRIVLGQAVSYLATAPKSNAAYEGINRAIAEVARSGPLPVPLHLRNAPTSLMKQQGHGEGYLYPHDHPDRVVDQAYLPDGVQAGRFYEPGAFGHEKTIAERMAWWARKRRGE
jgi:putative ATPase